MKKTWFAPLLLLACGMPVASAWASEPTSVDITLTGKIISNTCTIDKDASDLAPALDTISDRDMKGKGAVKGLKDIKIALTDCGVDTKSVEVTASGTAQDATGDVNAFQNTGTATGVGLYFYETDGTTPFSPAGNVKQTVPLNPDASGNAAMTFKAGYVSVTDAPVAGDFKSLVTLSLTYL
ncbi:Fimbrial subunit ElfA precursor [Serratia grimesii]|jgi:major type 1 subunit fimbrin (pilin)|uniref:fimbrial protein n=1 Tax=Serratia grimesii TaxID=82995 RepID=UPI001F4C4A7B|nr:fimbrial protein [Serratia grimesii]ULG12736.1 hypothetical protein 348p1_00099 [Serratia grimesii]CAI2793936.1 Fimbrial subunit ElfA precursor [Serratia grimesii]